MHFNIPYLYILFSQSHCCRLHIWMNEVCYHSLYTDYRIQSFPGSLFKVNVAVVLPKSTNEALHVSTSILTGYDYQTSKASKYCYANEYCYCQLMLLCQQILLCQCSWPVVRQIYTYGNWLWENACIWVATLLQSKYVNTPRVTSSSSICSQGCQGFCFVVQGICLDLTTAQAKA